MNDINDTYKIALFGHRDFSGHRELDKELYPFLKNIIRRESFVEIYIGRNGEFDIYAATLVKRVQNDTGKERSEFICVLPYAEKDMDCYEKYYDTVMIPECVEKLHPKRAITKRNQWMVENADMIIFYVERNEGGAYRAFKYAQRLKKQILNLAEKNALN